MKAKRQTWRAMGLAAAAVVGAGCEAFDVNLETPEPIKVDVTMRVDVYQYGQLSDEEKKELTSYKEVMERQRNRMAEIQELKNSRLVGENHLGLLEILHPPAGEYGEYVAKTVDAENVDRAFLMTRTQNEKGEELAAIQRREWKKRMDASFPGEWVEVEGDKPGTFKWVKKDGG